MHRPSAAGIVNCLCLPVLFYLMTGRSSYKCRVDWNTFWYIYQTILPRSVYCIMLGWVWIVWVHSLVVRIVRIVRTGQINLETSVCSSNQQQPGSYCKAAMQILQPGQRNKDLETFVQTGQRSRNFWFYWGYHSLAMTRIVQHGNASAGPSTTISFDRFL